MLRKFQIVCLYSISLMILILAAVIKADDSVIQLTTHKAPDYHCQWSPDGEYISFASKRTGEPKLFIVPAEGGEATMVESGLSGDFYSGWSSDGESLIFDAYGPDGPPPRLWLVPVCGGNAKRLLPDIVPCFHPTLSPESEWVAFVSMRSGNTDIWKARLNGDSLTQLTKSPDHDYHPRWSPDGRSIVFASDRTGNADIWIIKADGSDERQITTAPERDDHPSVSPDGKLIAFMSERTGKKDIWLMPITGGTVRRITEDGENAWPCFSPDGKHLVWSSNRDGQSDLYVGKVAND